MFYGSVNLGVIDHSWYDDDDYVDEIGTCDYLSQNFEYEGVEDEL